ncbi:Prefoldin, subunit 3 [Pelomyxa schiedti]|nr:Prefoldin, subunit 3 [Pelomyxa schiedti]
MATTPSEATPTAPADAATTTTPPPSATTAAAPPPSDKPATTETPAEPQPQPRQTAASGTSTQESAASTPSAAATAQPTTTTATATASSSSTTPYSSPSPSSTAAAQEADDANVHRIDAKYIEDVGAYIEAAGGAEQAIRTLQSSYETLKSLEASHTHRRASLMEKIPHIEDTLKAIEFLQEQRQIIQQKKPKGTASAKAVSGVEVTYELSSNVSAHATVVNPTVCNLWLGANVMMEYSLEEAHALLSNNREQAKALVEGIDADLAVIKDSIVTTEVNMARVYNWDVKHRPKPTPATSSPAAPSSIKPTTTTSTEALPGISYSNDSHS